MNELQIFNSKEFGEVRTTVLNSEPYFMLADVCRVLGIKNSRDALTRLNKKGVGTADILTNGGAQQATFINESNLYKLAFTSRKPEAEAFTEWVTSEVLPSIRKHGMYMTDNVAQQAITNPTEFLAKAVLVAQQELAKIKEENQVMKPKAKYFDTLVDRNTLTNFRDTAKEFHKKQKEFINWLMDNKFLYRDQNGKLKPYAGNEEYFHIKECVSKTNSWSGVQTLITPKGREAIRLLMQI